MSLIQKLGWVYAVMFFLIAALAYIPGIADDDGVVFKLFQLELHDDLLHLGSGIWAAIAAWLSTRATLFYFRLFGLIYAFDGVMGLFLGQGYLDGGIFLKGITELPLMVRIFANLPHILIGGIAIWIGFVFSKIVAARYA